MDSVIGYQASRRGGYARVVQTLSSVRLLGQVAVYLRGVLDSAIERLHNLPVSQPEPPPRAKPRRKLAAAPGLDRAPIFDDPEVAEPDADLRESSRSEPAHEPFDQDTDLPAEEREQVGDAGEARDLGADAEPQPGSGEQSEQEPSVVEDDREREPRALVEEASDELGG
jgi:hypothetical protein